MTLRIVPPDTEELWKRVVAANEAFVADTSAQTGEALVAAFDRFADAFSPGQAAIKAGVRRKVRGILECAA